MDGSRVCLVRLPWVLWLCFLFVTGRTAEQFVFRKYAEVAFVHREPHLLVSLAQLLP